MINDPLWGKIKCVDAEKLEELLKEIKPGIRCNDRRKGSMSDLISREAILKHIEKTRQAVQFMDDTHRASIIMNGMYLCEEAVRNQPSAQPEPLTDKEQRTFLRAMEREEKVCKHVDNVYNSSYEDSLVRTCHEITRKVKGALWTTT